MKKLILLLLLSTVTGFTQTVSVNDSITSFTQFTQPGGDLFKDILGDQQTGQGQDDFTVDGFYFNYGLLSTGEYAQLIRVRLNVYDANLGFTGNLRVGIDANLDGSVDLFYGVKGYGSTNQRGIVFQNPTNTGINFNVSPSTTALDSIYNRTAFTTTNYSYTAVNDSTNDAYLTFAVPFIQINDALNMLGQEITIDSYVRLIAFTSTQDNTINQDVYGTSGVTSIRFDEGGGFTEARNFYGDIPVVPEPSTYGAIFMGALLAVNFLYKKFKNA